ncbi:CAP domain-containing protein [Paenibacillus antri]
MQQAANNDANWLDWLNLDNLLGRNAPGRIAAPQQPPVQNVTPRQPPAQNVTPQQPPARNANPQSSGDASRFPQQVLDLVNKERAKAGLKSLSMNNELSRMAMDKAQDMINNNYFDHQSPTYGSPFDMMNAYGISYNTAAENIAKGQRSPTEVMSSWMNSQGHRANILNGSFTQIGVAYYNGGWVQVFIG